MSKFDLVNRQTGELVLTDDDGHETHLVYSEAAVEAIEVLLGQAILHVVARAYNRELMVRELRVVVHEGMRAWSSRVPGSTKKAPTADRAAKVVARVGVSTAMEAAAISLAASDYLGMVTPIDDPDPEAEGDEVDPTSGDD